MAPIFLSEEVSSFVESERIGKGESFKEREVLK